MTQRLAYLYKRLKQKSCSYEELNELLNALQDKEARELVEQLTEKDWQTINDVATEAREVDWDFMFRSILKKTRPLSVVRDKPSNPKFFSFSRLAVASIIVVVIGALIYLMVFHKQASDEMVKNKIPQNIQKDILPGGDKAILTLADGSKVVLDSANNGTTIQQGGVTVNKSGGRLTYKSNDSVVSEVLYNTITTPRGGQYQLVLSDGTKVWLNAASSLRYPTTFSGAERRVEITGEAYFEVTKNAAKPFKVSVDGKGEVEVLGTHFNINAYRDEQSISTTLLEGSVRFTDLQNKKQKTIVPGQQVLLGVDGQMMLNKNADLESVIAWKNGSFNFSSQDIISIMRQISRWYDVDVVYTGTISHETFSGIVSRQSDISEVLNMIKDSGVKFKIGTKKIIVQF